MNAQQLNWPDGKPSGVWVCGKCGHIHTSTRPQMAEEFAIACCGQEYCKVCHVPVEARNRCEACVEAERVKKAEALFAKAEKLTDFDGMVCTAGDTYHQSVDDWLCGLDEPPGTQVYAWCCKPMPLLLDADRLIENAMDDHHEDAYDQIGRAAIKALQAMLDEWQKPFAKLSVEPDFTRCVVHTVTE
jgi:hypothetical protein